MPFETAPTYIFDLHCDTLDRLALHKSFPDAGFMEQDAAIPDARMSSLASNDCHIALDRMAKAQYAWCQCFAAFIPDHMPADWGWQVFCAVRDFFQSQLAEHAALIEQVRDARDMRAMEQRRMVVDVSHLNDASFWDVVKASSRPFAASHSNSRAVCGHPRNLTDDMFRALVDRGGIVGFNFCRDFVREDGADPTRDDVLFHIDHFLKLGGEHAIALGSDYDGCDVPSWLEPAQRVGELHTLFAHEFGAEIANAICFENAAAFFERNETL